MSDSQNNQLLPSARKKLPNTNKSGNVKPVTMLNARGLRSRERMKQAALEMLNEKGYHSLRVQDITECAGVANGLFYRYFHDLREIVAEISSDFFDQLIESSGKLAVERHPYCWIYENHLGVVTCFAKNPGVLACLFGLSGDYEEYDTIWKRNAHKWNLQVTGFLRAQAGFSESHAQHMGFVLGAMVEGVIYQALIRHTEDLFEFGSDPEDIAETMAVMWYRAIFLENPPVALLGETGRHLVGDGG